MQNDLTPVVRLRAWDALRGYSIRQAPWDDLAEERRYHVNGAAMCAAALEAGDWREGSVEQLRGSLDWHTTLVAEIDNEGRRRQRAQAFGWLETPGHGSIAPERWAAAREIDCAELLRGLTGQAGKRSGRNTLFFCPFHDDRTTPSLTAYPKGRGWHCFACGAGGDAVALVARREGLTAAQALRLLESGAAGAGLMPR